MKTLLGLCVLGAAVAAEEWKAGPLTLEVHITRTANLFHIVDNLSNWDRYAHAQYRRAFGEPAGEDAEALELHAAIRRKKGWGGGLEQTFYTHLPLDQALAAGIEAGHVTEAEAERLGAVLRRFEGYADGLLAEEMKRLEAFRAALEKKLPDLETFARAASRLCHGRSVTVPVYLIANPADHSIGGGYNGGRLTLEVARKRDCYPTFLHELMHAFVNEERALLQAALAKAEGLDYTTLNEGIAYALSPGIFFDGQTLEERVAADLAAGKSFDNPYVRFNRYGLALRPLLKETLADDAATLTTFLPRALDAWRVVLELEKARRGKTTRQRGVQTFSSGPAWRALGPRVPHLYSFNHSADHYARILRRAAKGETFVLMFALDHEDRNVPEGYADLLPRPWAEIEAELKAGKSVEERHEARDLRIVVLAAPTVERLEELLAKTRLLQAGPAKRNVEVWSTDCDNQTYLALNHRMYDLYDRGVTGRDFETVLASARPGDVVIVPLIGDATVPDTFRPLLPCELDHATIEARKVKRGMTVVLLRAPTRERLITLVRRSRVLEHMQARAEPPARRQGRVYSLGGAYEALNTRMRKQHGTSATGRDHRSEHWAEVVGRARKGDLLVVLFTPERGPEPVPEEFADLLPMPRAEIDARVKKGETVEKEGEARGLRVVLLAAPSRAGLAELVSKTELLE